ncbi:MAG: protein-disulfide reductase DsbD [candidate division KSB1 bacterium]|nr:protein-disulfide reductase DsbD [candidate division KSB1 bacterium]
MPRKLRLVPGLFIVFLMTTSALTQELFSTQIVRVRGVTSFDKVYPGSTFQLAVIADIAPGWHINSHEPLEEFLIPTELIFDEKSGLAFDEVIYPQAIKKAFIFSESKLAVYEKEVILGTRLTLAPNFPLGITTIKGTLKYQACNDQTCLPPTEVSFEIPIEVVDLKQPANVIYQEIFSRIDFGPSETRVSKEKGEIDQFIREQGWLLAFLVIFLGGLALNLTPCVYPLIPITISYFGGQSQGKSGKTFVLALVYVLGMAIMYSILGVIAAFTGTILGASLQNPGVLIFVAVVFVALALSMFDIYEIRPPRFLMNFSGGSKQGYGGALFMGLTVGIVAAPCIGPFVFSLLTYIGASGNPFLGFGMFFTLALGLGLPYLILGIFSGAIHRLPRSGVWMVWVRKIFGFILIGMAIYFLEPLIPDKIYRFLLPILALISGVYLGWLEKSQVPTKTFQWVRNVVAILFIALGIWLVIPGAKANGIQWQSYNDERLAQARQAQKPVIIDFAADWCLPCKELDKVTFSDPEVIKLAQNFVLLKADLTRSEALVIKKLKNKFHIIGVPTIVFINPQGAEIKDLRVTGFITAEEFLERMAKALTR